MAIDTEKINKALLEDLMAIYNEAEYKMAQKVAKRVTRGITEVGWNESKLDDVSNFRKEIEGLLKDSKRLSSSKVGTSILKAYKEGVNSAENDAGKRLTAMKDLFIPSHIQVLLLETNNLLNEAHVQVLRNVDDMYRQVQAEASSMVLAGADTRIQGSQQMMDKLSSKGITGFIDKAGRKWSMSSYAEMAVRTNINHAAIQGHIDTQIELGEDLMQVSKIGTTCPLCAPWQGVVLSITGKTPGYKTIEQARAAGLFHPNCRHTITSYFPDIDGPGQKELNPPSATVEIVKRYEGTQKLRNAERHIRSAKMQKAGALDAGATRRSNEKILKWQQERNKICKEYGIDPRPYREGVKRANPRNASDLSLGNVLKLDEDKFKQVVGANPRTEFKKAYPNKFESREEMQEQYSKWIRDEVKDLDGLVVDKKQMSLTEVYKKYVGDSPSQDFKALGITDKSYAKWLKEQVEDIGSGYRIKPVDPPKVEPIKVAPSTMSPTEKYKKYVGSSPAQDFKKSGVTDKSYAKWLKEQADIGEKGATKTFENVVVEKQKEAVKETIEGAKKARDKALSSINGLTEEENAEIQEKIRVLKSVSKEKPDFVKRDIEYFCKRNAIDFDSVVDGKINTPEKALKLYEDLLVSEKKVSKTFKTTPIEEFKNMKSQKDYAKLKETAILSGDPERGSTAWYEKYFSKEAKLMSKDQYEAFKERVSQSPEFFQDYWALSSHKYELNNSIVGKVNIDSFTQNVISEDVAFYRDADKSIWLSLEKDYKNAKGQYSTLFHETGHALDFNGVGFLKSSSNKDFISTLGKEIKSINYDKAVRDLSSDNTSSGIQDLIHGVQGKRIRWGHGKEADGSDYWGRSKSQRMDRSASEAWAHIASSFSSPERFAHGMNYMPKSTYQFYTQVKEQNDKLKKGLEIADMVNKMK